MYESTSYYGRAGAVIQAMAGVDLALWDLKGKALKQPIWALLGGRPSKLRAYSSNMFQITTEATVVRAKQAIDAGFTGIKFGWEPFGRSDLALDLRYIEAIKAVTGSSVDFMLDVGHVWDAKTAIQRCRAYEPYSLAWIEEPLHPDDYVGYAALSTTAVQHIAAGEQECTVAGFETLIERGRINIAQIDLTRCGFTQSMKIAAIAARNGIKVANHCFTTDINVAAALHLLTTLPTPSILEYGVEPERSPVPSRATRFAWKMGTLQFLMSPVLVSSQIRMSSSGIWSVPESVIEGVHLRITAKRPIGSSTEMRDMGL